MEYRTSESPPGIVDCTCPACASQVAAPFFDGGYQPLATLAWPASPEAARKMERLPLDIVRCVACGHIFNRRFEYDNVPYSDKPNLMFNKGGAWSAFIRETQHGILSRMPERPTVVEIGYGDGSFLSSLAALRPEGRYVGFDPHGAATDSNLVDLRQEFFIAERDLRSLRPDIVISRHVLEHMMNPLGFLQKISCVAASIRLDLLAYLEVPCIDRVLETGRVSDFYYEHSSQFTTGSFSRMLDASFSNDIDIGHGYDREVIFGFAHFGGGENRSLRFAQEAAHFHAFAAGSEDRIRRTVDELHAKSLKIAIWGGTGKGAAFINRHGIDADRFPIVIDSDYDKIGTFVPGTGQEIRPRDWLRNNPVDVVIIPSQWRAADILNEMTEIGLAVESVLIEHDGRLIDFRRDDHPYGTTGEPDAPANLRTDAVRR
jgi:hypothetical protein